MTLCPRRTGSAGMLLVESTNLLQPENILLASKASETLIKVADFGVSKILREGTQMDTHVGTPYYQAPEILNKPHQAYTKQADIWSMRILLYFWYVNYALTEFIAFTVTMQLSFLT
jgi:serine/threonine protein kinase